MDETVFTYGSPQLKFGPGAIAEIAWDASNLGARSVAVVSDPGVADAGITQRVADVHAVPDHIACDADSRSEIVVPLVHRGELIGVFDLDSPVPDRFGADDQAGLEAITETFIASLA